MSIITRTESGWAAAATIAVTGLAAGSAAGGTTLEVTSVSPASHALTAAVDTTIEVTFDRPVRRTSVTRDSFWAFGRWSGTAEGSIGFADGDATIVLTPDRPFAAGESVMVILSHDLEAAAGGFLRSAGYSFQFWTRAGVGSLQFEEIDRMTTRTTQNETSRAYGGIGSDMNGDGWLDITVVNEDTADLRVFLNRADGTGLYEDFLQPPFPVGDRASPSEPSDFNHDGIVDVAVVNINPDTVSVLLGNGDGTLGPQQVIDVGGTPRGIAVLDVDGDGDADVVNTNAGSSNVSVMLNDGTGVFGPPTFFNAGVAGEWALAAADMNDDGILDLVVGGRTSEQIIVDTGNGDGTFTPQMPAPSGGAVWMLVCGDVNGDGHEDVAGVNSFDNNGAILLGDGAGRLGSLQVKGTDPFPLATDLADLDGDGDLDWITSSFSGDWFLFTNEKGVFDFDRSFAAPAAASCSVPLDIDNDGDLDLALIDELADLVILMRTVGSPCPEDLDASGAVDFGDILAILASWGPCASCPEDLDASGAVDFGDILAVLSAWGEC